jgi:hypothetical protein
MSENRARLAWTIVADGTTNLQIAQALTEFSRSKHGSSDIKGFNCAKKLANLPYCDPREIQLDGQHHSAISTDEDHMGLGNFEVMSVALDGIT